MRPGTCLVLLFATLLGWAILAASAAGENVATALLGLTLAMAEVSPAAYPAFIVAPAPKGQVTPSWKWRKDQAVRGFVAMPHATPILVGQVNGMQAQG